MDGTDEGPSVGGRKRFSRCIGLNRFLPAFPSKSPNTARFHSGVSVWPRPWFSTVSESDSVIGRRFVVDDELTLE